MTSWTCTRLGDRPDAASRHGNSQLHRDQGRLRMGGRLDDSGREVAACPGLPGVVPKPSKPPGLRSRRCRRRTSRSFKRAVEAINRERHRQAAGGARPRGGVARRVFGDVRGRGVRVPGPRGRARVVPRSLRRLRRDSQQITRRSGTLATATVATGISERAATRAAPRPSRPSARSTDYKNAKAIRVWDLSRSN